MNSTGNISRWSQSRQTNRVEDMVYQNSHTQQSFGGQSNQSSLKGKLANLDSITQFCQSEIESHRKELKDIQKDKDVIENLLVKKMHDTHSLLLNEIMRLDDELKRHLNYMNQESQRVQGLIRTMVQDQVTLDDTLIQIKKRITELEFQLGNTESN